MTPWTTALAGFALGLSLILAIGAQNAFVLRQGLRGEHVLLVCLTCAVSDALLIALGVAGFGAIVERAPWVEPAFRLGGAAFLIAYGLRSLHSAYRTTHALAPADRPATSWRRALATCLAFTWLNPHVYLDTVVLLGSVSTRYAGQRLEFALGAITASFAFFLALGYGARSLQPVFARPVAWRALDALVGLVMLALGTTLALG